MNEKDWNYTDSLPPHQRLYIRQAPTRVRVLIDNTMVHLPAKWLEGAYVLDDGGDIEDGYSLIRIPDYNNARGKVRNSEIVFFTQANPELLYSNRIEVGVKHSDPRIQALHDNLNSVETTSPFRYKDASSHDEEVEDAPEWLNNICNRIDALEAQVEELNEWTINAHEVIEEALEDYDLNEIVRNVIASYDYKNIVMSIIESPSFAHMIYNTVRQQSIRYQNSIKTLKEVWDGNTPLQYRDKGWK